MRLRTDQTRRSRARIRARRTLSVVARGEGIEAVSNRRRRFRVLAPDLADDADHRRRVEAPAEAASDADVADEMRADRGDERVPQLRDVRFVALFARRLRVEAPITADGGACRSPHRPSAHAPPAAPGCLETASARRNRSCRAPGSRPPPGRRPRAGTGETPGAP